MTERQTAVRRYWVEENELHDFPEAKDSRVEVIHAADFERVVSEKDAEIAKLQVSHIEAFPNLLTEQNVMQSRLTQLEQERERMVEAIKKLGEIIAPLREVEHE